MKVSYNNMFSGAQTNKKLSFGNKINPNTTNSIQYSRPNCDEDDQPKTRRFDEIMISHLNHFKYYTTEEFRIGVDCSAFLLLKNSQVMLIGSHQGKIYNYDRKEKKIISNLNLGNSSISKLLISKTQNKAYAFHDNGISIVTIESNGKLTSETLLENEMRTILLFPFENELLLVCKTGEIKRFDYMSYRLDHKENINFIVSTADFNSDQQILALGGEKGEIARVMINQRFEIKKNHPQLDSCVSAIVSVSDSNFIIAGYNNGNLYLMSEQAQQMNIYEKNKFQITAIVEINKLAFVARKDGKVVVWNIDLKNEVFVLDLSIYQIDSISLETYKEFEESKEEYFITFLSNEDISKSNLIPLNPRKILPCSHKFEENCSLFSYKEKLYLRERDNAFSIELPSNYSSEVNSFQLIDQSENISIQDENNIHKTNQLIAELKNSNNQDFSEVYLRDSKSFSSMDKYLLLQSKNECYLFNKKRKIMSFFIHSNNIHLLSMIKTKKISKQIFCVTETQGIYFWTIDKTNKKNSDDFVKYNKNIKLNRKRVITAKCIEQERLLVLVYDYEKEEENNLIELIETVKFNVINSIKLQKVKNILISKEKWLLCLQYDCISLFSIREFIKQFSITIIENPLSFCLHNGDIIIAYKTELHLYQKLLDDNRNYYLKDRRVIGNFDQVYKAYQQINKSIQNSKKRLKHKNIKEIINISTSDSPAWVLEPDHINELHIYAYLNDYHNLRKSLESGVGLITSRDGLTPLDICLELKHDESFYVIYSYLKQERLRNPFILSMVEHLIIKLIDSKLKSSSKLFKLFLCNSLDKTLPKFFYLRGNYCCTKNVLPYSFETNTLFPLEENTKRLGMHEMGNKLKFKQTYFRLSMQVGSESSIKLLTRIIHNEKNTFGHKLEFISHILDQKWKRIKLVTYTMIALYVSYFVLMNCYTFYRNKELLYIAYAINMVFLTNEVLQIIALKHRHFMVGWAVINLSNIVLTSVLFFATVLDYELNEYVEMFNLYTVWHRGYSYFRVTRKTGFYVNLIKWLFVDLFGFLIIFMFVTIGVAVIANAVYGFKSFFEALKFAWELNVGQFDTSDYRGLMYIVFAVATLFCLIILLNMLITIMTNTFNKLKNQILSSECKEIAQIIREAECLFYILNRNRESLEYIHKVTSNIKLLSENNSDDYIFNQKFHSLKNKVRKGNKNTKEILLKTK